MDTAIDKPAECEGHRGIILLNHGLLVMQSVSIKDGSKCGMHHLDLQL